MAQNIFDAPFYKPPATPTPYPNPLQLGDIVLQADALWTATSLTININSGAYPEGYAFRFAVPGGSNQGFSKVTWIAFMLPENRLHTVRLNHSSSTQRQRIRDQWTRCPRSFHCRSHRQWRDPDCGHQRLLPPSRPHRPAILPRLYQRNLASGRLQRRLVSAVLPTQSTGADPHLLFFGLLAGYTGCARKLG
jgi:hypothetical protein